MTSMKAEDKFTNVKSTDAKPTLLISNQKRICKLMNCIMPPIIMYDFFLEPRITKLSEMIP